MAAVASAKGEREGGIYSHCSTGPGASSMQILHPSFLSLDWHRAISALAPECIEVSSISRGKDFCLHSQLQHGVLI